MPSYARTVQTPALPDNFGRGLLGPFQKGRVVRGLHVFGQQADGTIPATGFWSLYATPLMSPDLPSAAEFNADAFLLDRFFGSTTAGGFLEVPYNVDVYLPLQVRFQRAGWVGFFVASGDPAQTSQMSVCAACGLGGVRSAKRRGRTIAIFG